MENLAEPLDLLILGRGWLGSIIEKHFLETLKLKVVSTTRSGVDSSIPWQFNPIDCKEEELKAHFKLLPKARAVLVTFPLPTETSGSIIIEMYKKVHFSVNNPSFILIGSTRAFHGVPGNPWCDRHGPIKADSRIQAEDWFLRSGGVVLNVAGLYGGTRQPKNWISDKIAPTKQALALKKSVHLIHGLDIARLTYAVTQNMTPGERWLVTDLRVYGTYLGVYLLFLDWWDLILNLDEGDGSQERKEWLMELLFESKTKSIPRSIGEEIDRAVDSKETWMKFNLLPNETLYRPR
jgi:hypothetical protein